MQIKKFEANTIQEALENIKRELGPEAIILKTRQNKGGFGLLSKPSFEVTAAVSERAIAKVNVMEKRLPKKEFNKLKALPAGKQSEILNRYNDHQNKINKARSSRNQEKSPGVGKITSRRYADIDSHEIKTPAQSPKISQTKERIQNLSTIVNSPITQGTQINHSSLRNPANKSIQEQLADLQRKINELSLGKESPQEGLESLIQDGRFGTIALKNAYEQLIVNGIEKSHAIDLISKVASSLGDEAKNSETEAMDALASEIIDTTEVISLLDGINPRGENEEPVKIALVGPTGVGKTTTVAKIASEAILTRGLRVGLINIDSYRIGAKDQLETYANILKVPFRSISDSSELQDAVEELKRVDLILIDTTGRSPKDTESLADMKKLLSSVPGVRQELVLSCTTRDMELFNTGKRFSAFRPDGLIISKLDEAVTFGNIYNISQRLKLPLMYFTTGQTVPDDIEEASPERIAALLLDI